MTVKKKGWWATEMNTWDADKKKQVLEQYGKDGLTENTYNLLRARVKSNDNGVATSQAQDPAMEMLHGDTLSGLNMGYTSPATLVVHPIDTDINKYLYQADEEGGTYYGGHLKEVKTTAKKSKATRATATDFLNEYQNDPAMLFNPNYAETRKKITDQQWIKLIERHPEYWNRETSKYIPDSAQTKLLKRGMRLATDAAANHVVLLSLGATNPLAAIASITGAKMTDEIVKLASDKYAGWQDMVATKLREKGVDNELIVNTVSALSNPGSWVGGIAGSFATPTYSFTGSPTTKVAVAGKPREVYTGADLVHPTLVTGSKEVTVPEGMVETAAEGISRYPALGGKTVVSKTSYTPGNIGGGLGKGRGRIGGGGKGLNPRGQMQTEYSVIPEVVRGDAKFNLPYAYVNGLAPIEYTLSDHVTQRPIKKLIPPVSHWDFPDFYQTGYDWGDADFLTWWEQNAPGNEGKVLDYNGRKIKIEWDPEGYRMTNIHTGVPGGAYPQGTITGKEVLGERHIVAPLLVIPGHTTIMSNPRLVPYKVTLGDTVTLRHGGSINYLDYFNK